MCQLYLNEGEKIVSVAFHENLHVKHCPKHIVFIFPGNTLIYPSLFYRKGYSEYEVCKLHTI